MGDLKPTQDEDFLLDAEAVAKAMLPRWAYTLLKQRSQQPTEKAYGSTTAEERAAGGLHSHRLLPGTADTKSDGAHVHAFVFPSGEILHTEMDGQHQHSVRGEGDVPDGAHTHIIRLPLALSELYQVDELETKAGGAHCHEALANRTTLGGIHCHELALPNGETIKSLMPEDMREAAKQRRDSDSRTKLQKADPIVPNDIPACDVLFVGGAPDKIEWARREPLVGMCGRVLLEKYEPLLGDRSLRTARINAIPILLENEEGQARQPAPKEIEQWRPWLMKHVDALNPKVIIALGWVAKEALQECADVVVPHPNALRKHWDSGEVARKLRRVPGIIIKHAATLRHDGRILKAGMEDAGGGSYWFRAWHRMLPSTGTGRFIYQNHFVGLAVDERNGSHETVLQSNSKLNAELRLEGPLGAWGWSIKVGNAEDNRARAAGNALADILPSEAFRAIPKIPHDHAWMEMGRKSPKIIPPGRPGAAANSYAKIFAVDQGRYTLGRVTRDSVELFLDGTHLKGRYLVSATTQGQKTGWLIDKPSSQSPAIEALDLDAEVADLKSKGQRHLYWSAPGQRPQKIQVQRGEVTKNQQVKIWKSDETKRIVYGVVLDPYQVDAHSDWISPKEIERTAHNWFTQSRVISLDHKGLAEATAVESWVEQYPSREDYLKAHNGEAHKSFRRKFGNDQVHSGAWILGTKLSPDLWAAFERGELQAYSIEGFAQRRPIAPIEMPHVDFVELVELETTPSAE